MPESIRLYLLHHAEAVRPDDPSAPLSPRGEAQVRALAAFLEKSGPPAVERVWHSPWAAPRETTDRLCDHLGIAATRREIAGLLPGDEVRGIARRLSGFGYPLMVVGHMPHLGRLVSVLVSGVVDHEIVDPEPGALLCLERKATRSRAILWHIRWCLAPSLLLANESS